MNSKFILIIFTLLILQLAQSPNWFTSTLISPFTFLKNKLFGTPDKFSLKNMDEVHKALTTRFLELKDDGLALSYNLIYYNLVLNLERECFAVARSVRDCELFNSHMKSIITENVKSGREGYQYMLIEDFFTKIFDTSDFDFSNPQTQDLFSLLAGLGEYFNGPLFEETRKELTFHYNSVLEKLMSYLVETIRPALGNEADIFNIADSQKFVGQESDELEAANGYSGSKNNLFESSGTQQIKQPESSKIQTIGKNQGQSSLKTENHVGLKIRFLSDDIIEIKKPNPIN